MKLSDYTPSWTNALSYGGLALGSIAGLASRMAQSASWDNLLDVNRTMCQAGFDNPVLDGINALGQWEIATLAILSSALIPLAGKISYDAYSSKESTALAKVTEAFKKNLSVGQGAGIVICLGLGCGVAKPMLKQIWQPFTSKEFNPSGHFFTRILASALGASVLKRSFQENQTTQKVSTAWYAFNTGKDGVLLFATLANQCHSIPEAFAGSLVAASALAVL